MSPRLPSSPGFSIVQTDREPGTGYWSEDDDFTKFDVCLAQISVIIIFEFVAHGKFVLSLHLLYHVHLLDLLNQFHSCLHIFEIMEL